LIQKIEPLLVSVVELLYSSHTNGFDSVPALSKEGSDEPIQALSLLLWHGFNNTFNFLFRKREV
jgi:hypothetical protein